MHRLPTPGTSRLPKPKSTSALSNGVANAKHTPSPRPPPQRSASPPPARLQAPHNLTNLNGSHNGSSIEVTALSDKLMHSFNDQTKLDERLQHAKRESQSYQRRLAELEAQTKQYERDIADGVLVRRSREAEENAGLRRMLEQERSERIAVETEKREIELELENLTAALFEEANKMVAEVKKDRELAEKKNDQLRVHLIDTEALLSAQQEQLDQLKTTIQRMQDDRAELERRNSASTVSTSSLSPRYRDSLNRLVEPVSHSNTSTTHGSPVSVEIRPAPPTSFIHLIKPVCSRDTPGYADFHSMLRVLRGFLDNPTRPSTAGLGRFTSGAPSWPFSSSGAATPTKLGGQSSLKPPPVPPIPPQHSSPASSSPSQIQRPSSAIPTVWSPSSSSSSPATSFPPFGYHIPSSSSSLTPSRPPTPSNSSSTNRSEYISAHNALKETRFFKRVAAEDIEPTLRLDIAPGISWLTRRSVLSSMFDGNLIIEPLPTSVAQQSCHCVLCGESRRAANDSGKSAHPDGGEVSPGLAASWKREQQQRQSNPRTHGFRTSGSETAQRYALCTLCLEKMRSCCELVGYLRLLVDGHVRIDDEMHERDVWEEIVRLRERMFWAKVGAGVVPAILPALRGRDDGINGDG